MQQQVRGEKIIVGGLLLGTAAGVALGFGAKFLPAAVVCFFLAGAAVKFLALVWGYNTQRGRLAATEEYGELVAKETAERIINNSYSERPGA